MDINAILEENEQTAWVEFLDTEINLAFISSDTLKRLLKKNTKVKFARKKGRTETIDHEGLALDIGRAAVRDWKNITLKGEEYPYSPDNCDTLMVGWAEFGAFVIEACSEVANFQEEAREEDVKKSSSSSPTE